MVLFPFFEFALMIGYFAFWVVVALYIFSVEVKTTEDMPDTSDLCTGKNLQQTLGQNDYIDYDWDEKQRNTMWYHVFAGFWGVQFISYWSFSVLAGIYSSWYFSPW